MHSYLSSYLMLINALLYVPIFFLDISVNIVKIWIQIYHIYNVKWFLYISLSFCYFLCISSSYIMWLCIHLTSYLSIYLSIPICLSIDFFFIMYIYIYIYIYIIDHKIYACISPGACKNQNIFLLYFADFLSLFKSTLLNTFQE